MTVKLLTEAELRAAAQAGSLPADAQLRKAFAAEVKAPADETSRVLDFTISTAAIDRVGDSVAVDGWKLDAYRKNPVVLWAHDPTMLPVAKASSLRTDAGALKASAEFMPRDISGFADAVFQCLKQGYLSAVSVGFIPLKYAFVDDPARRWGIDFEEQELLEFSVVPIPANPEALVEARSIGGIDTEPFRHWAARLLDQGGSVLVPRDLLEETFRQAKTPTAVRRRYLAKSDTADWKVGASSDLPVDTATAWDGAAAAKRMLDDAGFDGESPDATKAARGFLIHDAANPALRSSYKLPFADLVDGTLKAIEGGIRAAASRLPQTDAPEAVREEARKVLDGYETKLADASKAALKKTSIVLDIDTTQFEARIGKVKAELDQVLEQMEEAGLAPGRKAGRRISSANEAHLKEALGHHESASACIRKVLDSNAPDDAEPDQDPDDDQPEVIEAPVVTPPPPEDTRSRRLREAKELLAAAKR
jgi:HK97 family phage prohead protease